MKKHWKKILVAVVGLVVAVIAATFVYVNFIKEEADPEFETSDVKELLDATTTVAPGQPVTSDATDDTVSGTSAPAAATEGVEGEWIIAEGSEVGYRVDESINGFDSTANGRTQAVTGTFTIGTTTVTAGEFTVDMTTFESDESRRDGQFDGRIMDVTNFPTATFVLTAPIDFQQVPTDGTTITATATGDLTLRGTTNPVTFEVEATFQNGRVGVLGKIPIVFADYGIPNPSFATITTEDNGLLEFILAFDPA